MILHSDNTATDMALKFVGPDNVRKFVAAAGLKNTQLADSTRIMFGYVLGIKDYLATSWSDLEKIESPQNANCPLNNVQTMAASSNDLVSYYPRALHGGRPQPGAR